MTHQELLAQAEELTRQAEELRKQEVAGKIAEIKAIMSDHGITSTDLGFNASPVGKRPARPASQAKYRDPISGKSWTGKGRQPEWISGRDRAQFEIRS